ncbi:MAG: non-homologous end-joining DNA ligase [Acidimicrobiales bacterium]
MSRVEVTNPDRVLFPAIGVTKGQVVDYYARVADHLLPHVAGRPLVLERFPRGIDGQGFYQKNLPDHAPEWLARVEIPTVEGGVTRYGVVDDADGLVWVANQSAVVLHTLLAEAAAPQRPVEVIFDLDPADDDLGPVQSTARALRHLLVDLGLAPRVKSSGSQGLHLVVDVIDDDATYARTEGFAHRVAELVADRLEEVTTEHRKRNRRGRLFLDVLRNGPASHAVAPYSLRARPEAPVAAPLTWDEALSPRFHPRRITIGNVFRRLAQIEDPWASISRPSTTIAEAAEALDEAVR